MTRSVGTPSDSIMTTPWIGKVVIGQPYYIASAMTNLRPTIHAFFAASRNASRQLVLNSSIQTYQIEQDHAFQHDPSFKLSLRMKNANDYDSGLFVWNEQLTLCKTSMRENLQKFQQVRHGEEIPDPIFSAVRCRGHDKRIISNVLWRHTWV